MGTTKQLHKVATGAHTVVDIISYHRTRNLPLTRMHPIPTNGPMLPTVSWHT